MKKPRFTETEKLAQAEPLKRRITQLVKLCDEGFLDQAQLCTITNEYDYTGKKTVKVSSKTKLHDMESVTKTAEKSRREMLDDLRIIEAMLYEYYSNLKEDKKVRLFEMSDQNEKFKEAEAEQRRFLKQQERRMASENNAGYQWAKEKIAVCYRKATKVQRDFLEFIEGKYSVYGDTKAHMEKYPYECNMPKETLEELKTKAKMEWQEAFGIECHGKWKEMTLNELRVKCDNAISRYQTLCNINQIPQIIQDDILGKDKYFEMTSALAEVESFCKNWIEHCKQQQQEIEIA